MSNCSKRLNDDELNQNKKTNLIVRYHIILLLKIEIISDA
jgi:hypothetical protein